ncbi:MAG: O-antigen ligase family protein [Candidatus Eremiobacteraeota bacterium]|nr:O-antigen ligase family protein [Candidatus Eremiobacteraeota bacterium]
MVENVGEDSGRSGRVSETLRAIRDGGLHLFLLLVICFPLLVAFREFVVFLTRDPAWGPILGFVDAGAQRPLARSMLRGLLTAGCLIGLLLPFPKRDRSGTPWAALFLLLSLLSVSLSGRVYAAESEWETWALILLFAIIVRRIQPAAIRITALIGLYVTCLVVFFHALWIAVPVSDTRLGGVFHHPNALSTFTVFALPVLLYRSRLGGLEGYAAAFLAGSMLTIQLWSGSLTGACILVFGLFFWLLRLRSQPVRWGVSLLGMTLPVAMNLTKGYPSSVGFITLFLALLTFVFLKMESRYFRVSVLFLLSLLLCAGAFTALAPTELSGRIISDRSNSAQARLHFYRAGGFMAAESPLLGQGPAAFPHEYPRYQGSIQYFSRFVHCIPLEVLIELGLLGLVTLAGMLYSSIWKGEEEEFIVFQCAFAAFALHCLTGVQTQFPYLLALPAVAWAVSAPPRPELEKSRFGTDTAARVFLSVALLVLLNLNFTRIEAAIDQNLASQLYRSGGDQARMLAHKLFQDSIELEPTNGSYLLAYSQVFLSEEEQARAQALALAAMDTDLGWAAPRRVQLSATRSLSAPAVEEALAIDPVNYPDFYRMKAELLATEGATAEALEILQKKSEDYRPMDLNRLPAFRAEDLEEQLVQFWLLIAVLEERQGRPHQAESAFRKSLFMTRRLLPRYRRMIRYPEQSGLSPGPVVGQLLGQLTEQIPAK